MSSYFYGNKISDEGVRCGYVDYATFAKAFDCVLCNSIWNIDDMSMWDNLRNDCCDYYYNLSNTSEEITPEEYLELSEEESENWEHVEYRPDVFQWFIVSNNAVSLLEEAGEVYTYSEKLGVYIWGVCHWGTSWDYVLTNIRI